MLGRLYTLSWEPSEIEVVSSAHECCLASAVCANNACLCCCRGVEFDFSFVYLILLFPQKARTTMRSTRTRKGHGGEGGSLVGKVCWEWLWNKVYILRSTLWPVWLKLVEILTIAVPSNKLQHLGKSTGAEHIEWHVAKPALLAKCTDKRQQEAHLTAYVPLRYKLTFNPTGQLDALSKNSTSNDVLTRCKLVRYLTSRYGSISFRQSFQWKKQHYLT